MGVRRARVRATAGRAVVAALLLTGLFAAPALAAPAPGPARVPGPKPDALALEAKAVGLQARLDQQYAALERISEQYDKAIAAEDVLRGTLEGVQARRKAVVTELATAQQALDERAREIYEAGPGWFVEEFVGAAEPSDVLRRVPMEKSALEASARTVEEVAGRKAEIDELTARAEAGLAEQQRLDAGVLSQHQRINALAKQLETTIKGIDKRLAGVLQAQQRRAEAARRAAFNAWYASLGGRGQASWMEAGRAAASAVAFAMGQLGKPYQWGAEGPSTFDCSGLTSAAYHSAGLSIPRVAVDQFGAGQQVAVADLLPGDLVFYADDPVNPATVHHVGIYIGKGLMVHAPHTGDVVRVASIWRDGYAGAVRVVAGGRRPGASPPTTTAPPPPPPMMTTPPPTTRPPVTTGRPAPGSSVTTAPPSTSPATTAPATTSSTTTTTEPATTAPAPSTTASGASGAATPTTGPP